MRKNEVVLLRVLFGVTAAAMVTFLILREEGIRRETFPASLHVPFDNTNAVEIEGKGLSYVVEQNRILLDKGSFLFNSENYQVSSVKNESGMIYTVNFDINSGEKYYDEGGGPVKGIGFDAGTLSLSASEQLVIEVEFNDKSVEVSAVPLREGYDRIVYIDAGHGGTDDGAVRNKINEDEINLKIALMVRDMIVEGNSGIYPYLSRKDDTAVNRYDRAAEGSAVADIIVSIHCNTFDQSGINGTEVYYNPLQVLKPDNRTDLTSAELAAILQRNVCEAAGSNNRGIRDNTTIVLISVSTVPCVIVETGYMTNPEELALLVTEDYQRKLAEGIYNGILEAFGIVN